MRDVWRRYWALVLLAVGVIVLSGGFLGYVLHRADLVDQRTERQRAALCAILANIPGRVPAEIENARQVFASHPGECNPIKGVVPPPTTFHVTINGQPEVVVVNPTPSSPEPTASPSPSRTASPPPTPSRSPTHSPPPRPSPSPTPCTVPDVIQHPVHCLHLEENP